MDVIVISLALICGALGLLGAVLPALPGPPFSYAGVLLLLLCDAPDLSVTFLAVSGVVMLLITVVDYILPVWFTQLSGGSRESVRGALAGMLVGLFFLPLGIIIGPFIGAFAGEYIVCNRSGKAFKVASLSFVAFIVTTALKIVYGAVMLYYIVAAVL